MLCQKCFLSANNGTRSQQIPTDDGARNEQWCNQLGLNATWDFGKPGDEVGSTVIKGMNEQLLGILVKQQPVIACKTIR